MPIDSLVYETQMVRINQNNLLSMSRVSRVVLGTIWVARGNVPIDMVMFAMEEFGKNFM